MKKCPKGGRDYNDDSMSFCLDDGSELLFGPASMDEPQTAILSDGVGSGEPRTQILGSSAVKEPLSSDAQNAPSIAVLPFVNISADDENEYFCDGLAEELLNALAKIEGLKVAARTSAFAFKGKNTNISEIAETLGVKTILEGSVRKSANRLRITAQLINAADGYHLWSELYDREMKDIFDVQDEITLAVVDALKMKLLGDNKAVVLKKGTADLEAHELFLKGRFFAGKFTKVGYEQAIKLFEQAIEIDPNYALAYVALADAYFYQTIPDSPVAKYSPSEAVPKIFAAAETAIRLDETLAEGWATLAHIKEKTRDIEGAREAYRRSFELDAKYPTAHSSYGAFLSALGEHDAAVREAEIACSLDPFSVVTNSMPGLTLYYARRYDEAIAHWERVKQLDLTFPAAGTFGGLPYVMAGRVEEAIQIFRLAADASEHSTTSLACLGHALAVAGKSDEAVEILDQLLSRSKTTYVSAYGVALVYVGLADNEAALRWLDIAFEENNLELIFLREEPRFDPLRTEPRYIEMVKHLGF